MRSITLFVLLAYVVEAKVIDFTSKSGVALPKHKNTKASKSKIVKQKSPSNYLDNFTPGYLASITVSPMTLSEALRLEHKFAQTADVHAPVPLDVTAAATSPETWHALTSEFKAVARQKRQRRKETSSSNTATTYPSTDSVNFKTDPLKLDAFLTETSKRQKATLKTAAASNTKVRSQHHTAELDAFLTAALLRQTSKSQKSELMNAAASIAKARSTPHAADVEPANLLVASDAIKTGAAKVAEAKDTQIFPLKAWLRKRVTGSSHARIRDQIFGSRTQTPAVKAWLRKKITGSAQTRIRDHLFDSLQQDQLKKMSTLAASGAASSPTTLALKGLVQGPNSLDVVVVFLMSFFVGGAVVSATHRFRSGGSTVGQEPLVAVDNFC